MIDKMIDQNASVTRAVVTATKVLRIKSVIFILLSSLLKMLSYLPVVRDVSASISSTCSSLARFLYMILATVECEIRQE